MDSVFDRITRCILAGVPFAAFGLSGEKDITLYINPSYPEGDGDCFVISPWLGKYSATLKVYNEMCGDKSLCDIYDKPAKESIGISTDRERYLSGVSNLISVLKGRGGKTVISRIITGSTESISLSEFIRKRFERYPDTFRFVYYTPETDLWIGTSPEELLTYDRRRHRFSITALAGTRKTGATEKWDTKNIVEQSLVSTFIGDTLDKFNIRYIHKLCKDVEFYPVRHICHRFIGEMDEGKIPALLDELSPTPALCGFPREESIREIAELEPFDRECYGGYVGVCSKGKIILYVNLRSILIRNGRYCIFVGGGITGASVPENEWEETVSKSSTMIEDLESCKFFDK